MAKIDPKAAKKQALPPAKTAKAAPPAKVMELVPVTQDQDMQALLALDAGSGLELMTKDDFAVPRLAILQLLSPVVNKRDEAYIDGAEVGMIHDNVSGNLYDGQDGILMVLVSFRRCHIEWWPRDSKKGKGFVADHGLDPAILQSTTRNDNGQNITAQGSEIVPTAEYFGFLINEEDGTFDRVLISMAKSQLKCAKKLNTMAATLLLKAPNAGKLAPLFYRTYRLKTIPESNDKGNWFIWDATPGPETLSLPNGHNIYLNARAFRLAIQKGDVKVADPVSDADTNTASSGGDDAPM